MHLRPPVVLFWRGERSGGNREINGVNWLVQAHFSAVRVVKKQIELYLLGHGLFFCSVPNHHVHSPPPEPLRDSLEAALLALKQTESLTFWATALKKQQIESHRRSSSAFPLRRSLSFKNTAPYPSWWRCICSLWGKLSPGRTATPWTGPGWAGWWWPTHSHSWAWKHREQFWRVESDILNQELKIKQIPIMWHSW